MLMTIIIGPASGLAPQMEQFATEPTVPTSLALGYGLVAKHLFCMQRVRGYILPVERVSGGKCSFLTAAG